jgi:hypothetical protein
MRVGDAGKFVYQGQTVDAIAGKPAPTKKADQLVLWICSLRS